MNTIITIILTAEMLCTKKFSLNPAPCTYVYVHVHVLIGREEGVGRPEGILYSGKISYGANFSMLHVLHMKKT